jgi:hypothetical protein
MRCFLSLFDDHIDITVRAESEDGGVVGDAHWVAEKGMEFFSGVDYQQLSAAARDFGFIDIPVMNN